MTAINVDEFNQRRFLNIFQSVLLIGAMSVILALSAEFLFGEGVWPFVFAGVGLSLLVAPSVSPRWILQLYRARPLAPNQAGSLYALLERIAGAAGLDSVPTLYWVPSNTLNAFTVGSRDDAAIAMTHGLLNRLTPRELAAVLAHETSHIANNDMRIMGLADAVSRLTHVMALFGLLLTFASLPLML
ncbi:MAG: Zn-dependent protease, partial [Proteobacteria bacterium]